MSATVSRSKLMGKIEKLPEELERRLPEIRDEWIQIGLSTEPAKREQAEKGVDTAYRVAGLEPPETKIWLRSPREGVVCAAYLQALLTECYESKLKENLNNRQKIEWVGYSDKEFEGPFGNIDWKVLDAVEKNVLKPVECQVGEQVRDRVSYSVYSSDTDKTILTRFRKSIDHLIKAQNEPEGFYPDLDMLQDEIRRARYGQHDAGWLAICSVFRELLPELSQYDHLQQIAKSCGWWWPFKNIVILTERPCIVHKNFAGELHCEDGPALEYSDGFNIFAWDGHILREDYQWIVKDKTKLTPDIIGDESYSARRLIMLDAYGFENYLNHRPHQVIDEDNSVNSKYRLLDVKVADQNLRVLDIWCETAEPQHKYFIGLFYNIKHAIASVKASSEIHPGRKLQKIKIKNLPDPLKQRLPNIRDGLIRAGQSTEPANREQAEKGVDLVYEVAGRDIPRVKKWVQSPLEGAVEAARRFIQNRAIPSAVYTEFLGWYPENHQVEDGVTREIRDQVEARVDELVWTYAGSLVLEQVKRSFLQQFDIEVWKEVVKPEYGFGPQCGHGQFDSHMLSHYQALKELGSSEARAGGLWLIACSCGWWWPYPDFAILTERPHTMLRDNAGRLHCGDGPALEYADSFRVYAWHGTLIPENYSWIVTDKSKLTPDVIENTPTIKLRRIMQEIRGDQKK